MRLVAASRAEGPRNSETETETETLLLTPDQVELLRGVSAAINPAMPVAFGGAHAIRLLLEHFEKAEIDLSAASSEDEVSQLAASALRQKR